MIKVGEPSWTPLAAKFGAPSYESNHRFSEEDQTAEYLDAGHLKETEVIALPPTGLLPNFHPIDLTVSIFFPSEIALFNKSCGCKMRFVGALRVKSLEYKVSGSLSAPKFSRFAALITGNSFVWAPLKANAM